MDPTNPLHPANPASPLNPMNWPDDSKGRDMDPIAGEMVVIILFAVFGTLSLIYLGRWLIDKFNRYDNE